MPYQVISCEVQKDYADAYEGAVIVSLRRDDGVEGDVWVAAGVPPYLQGTAQACGHVTGLEDVRMWGDCLQDWCPDQFAPPLKQGEDETEDAFRARTREHYEEIVEACRAAALKAWHNFERARAAT